MVTMVLCTGGGPVETVVDLGGRTPKADTSYDWANAQIAVLASAPFDPAIRALTYLTAQANHASALWQPAYDPRNLWAHGPSIFA